MLVAAGCGAAPATTKIPSEGASRAVRDEDLFVVDCLLPAQVRQLGGALTYVGPRRAIRTSGRDCQIRGGEYVTYDRADYATALKVWLPQAQDGDKVAQTNVGEIYEKGLGIAPDYVLAATWYARAAAQGYARAQINLGHLYEKGLGVEKNPSKALELYRQASGLTDAIALNPVGINADMQREVRALTDELERRKRDTQSLQAQLDRTRVELERTKDDLQRRSTELEAEQRRAADIRQELERTRRQSAAADEAKVRLLQDELARHQADLTARSDTVTQLRQQVLALEQDAERNRVRLQELSAKPVALPGPAIEIIEPTLPLTRGVTPVRISPGTRAVTRLVIGRVFAAAGLLAFTINDQEQSVAEGGLFRADIPVTASSGPVRIVAVDKQGKREQIEFRFAVEPDGSALRSSLELPRTVKLGEYYALVIGNRNYRHWPSLATTEIDAVETARVLEQRYGFKTRLLIDARRADVLQALNDLRAQLTENDNLLVFYAGHGHLDEKINRTYWIPVDGQLDNNVEWISTVAITDSVGAMSAKHVLLVIDSCFSGALTRSALESGMSPEARQHWLEVMASKRSRTVLSSGEVKPVLDAGGGRHSVFAKAWLDILQENRDVIEGQRIYNEVARRVAYAADAMKFEQVPQYAPIRFAGHESGDFLFVPR